MWGPVAKIPLGGVRSNLSCSPCVRITAAKEPSGCPVGPSGGAGGGAWGREWGRVGAPVDPRWGPVGLRVVAHETRVGSGGPRVARGPEVANDSLGTSDVPNESFATFEPGPPRGCPQPGVRAAE